MKKVVVTGGSGRLGQLVIQELVSHGSDVLSLDKVRAPDQTCPAWIADLRSPGDLYQAFAGAAGVIHLAAYQAPALAPDCETFSNNVSATYNVLRAAADLGVGRVVIGSSTAAFGFIYAIRPMLPEYLPLDEAHPSRPQDPYGLSKLTGEIAADSIAAAHPDLAIASLRFPGVVFDFSYSAVRARWKDPGARARTSWAYIDGRDAAAACRLALEAPLTGHQVMIVAAPGSSMREPTAELIARHLGGGIPIKTAAEGNWSGVSSAKAARTIGFKARYGWENQLQI